MTGERGTARACAGVLGIGVLILLTGGVHAADKPTLSQYIKICETSTRVCRANLRDYTEAASTQGLICMPKDLDIEDAIDQELQWLRHAASHDDKLYTSSIEDAEWEAVSTMWPCKQEQPQQPTAEPSPQPPQQ